MTFFAVPPKKTAFTHSKKMPSIQSPDLPPKAGFYRHLPNVFTFLRLLITPLTYLFIIDGLFGYAFLCFLFAGLSDGIDGYLARRWDVVSKIGRILDPIADKALIFITFITLGYLGKIPLWLVFLVISRDILIILCGFITFIFKFQIRLAPIWSSKLNTFFQISLVGIVLLAQTAFYKNTLPELGQHWLIDILIITTGLTTVWSGIQYGVYFTKQLYLLKKRGRNVTK